MRVCVWKICTLKACMRVERAKNVYLKSVYPCRACVRMHVHMRTWWGSCMHTCACVHMCVCMCTCMYICVFACASAHKYVYVRMHVYACAHVRGCVHARVCECTCAVFALASSPTP